MTFQRMIDEALSEFNGSDSAVQGLYEPLTYMIANGGKRLRPILVMMGCDLFEEDPEKSLPAAVAVELFHNFTLIHDDIMDEAQWRRGKASVYGQWGRDSAILSGDAAFVRAYQELQRLPSSILPEVLEIFNHTALKVCEGQQLDMDLEERTDVTLSEYLDMIDKKTAALIAGSLEIGAVIGGAEEEDRISLRSFGRSLGTAFQILDDLLDLYAEDAAFGKEKGGDIKAGKNTFLSISAREKATEEQKSTLREAMEELSGDERVSRVRGVFDSLNIKGVAEEAVRERHRSAMEQFDRVRVPAENKEELKALGELLNERTH